MASEDTFTRPDDETILNTAPTHQESNPHLQSSKRGVEPTQKAAPNTKAFTCATFPRIVLPIRDLLGNIADTQRIAIEESPNRFLAILPFGAGMDYNTDAANRNAEAEMEDLIRGLGFDNTGLDVVKAVPKYPPKRKYEKPWIYILEGGSPALRQFLEWQQTFSFETRTFSVIPFDPNTESWVITNICGSIVTEDQTALKTILLTIKKTLWENPEFRRVTNKCFAEARIEGSVSERVFKATTSYTLSFIECNDSNGNRDPILQLMGKPIATNPNDHQEYLTIIRKVKFWKGIRPFESTKRAVNCACCKADTHPGHSCPFARVQGWLGPKPQAILDNPQNDHRGGGMERRPSSRRGRGGRGRSHGQPSSRGPGGHRRRPSPTLCA